MVIDTHASRSRTLGPRTSGLRALGLGIALALGSAWLAPSAHAGEVRFGAAPLEIDDAGKLTESGKGAAVKQLPSVPGEELWVLHVWAQLDKGAPGPLYVEFFDKLPGSGKRYRAYQHEQGDYDGGKYVSLEIELKGDVGFNKGHTYTVELSQVDSKGKNLILATGQLELVYTEGKKDDDEEGEDEDDGEDQSEAQDAIDSFAGGEEGEGGDQAPPPVTAPGKKKGCSVDPGVGAAPGVLVLMLLGAGLRRRRSSAPR
jgi:MYXO-CTERM domain-containing protein